MKGDRQAIMALHLFDGWRHFIAFINRVNELEVSVLNLWRVEFGTGNKNHSRPKLGGYDFYYLKPSLPQEDLIKEAYLGQPTASKSERSTKWYA